MLNTNLFVLNNNLLVLDNNLLVLKNNLFVLNNNLFVLWNILFALNNNLFVLNNILFVLNNNSALGASAATIWLSRAPRANACIPPSWNDAAGMPSIYMYIAQRQHIAAQR